MRIVSYKSPLCAHVHSYRVRGDARQTDYNPANPSLWMKASRVTASMFKFESNEVPSPALSKRCLFWSARSEMWPPPCLPSTLETLFQKMVTGKRI